MSLPFRRARDQALPWDPDLLYYEEHSPPHFHAKYAGQVAVVDIASLAVLRGDLPGRALGLVVEWGRMHREELEANWTRARQAEPLLAVEPLE